MGRWMSAVTSSERGLATQPGSSYQTKAVIHKRLFQIKRQELDPLYGPQDLNGCPTLGVQFRISGRDLALWRLFLLDGDCWTLT